MDEPVLSDMKFEAALSALEQIVRDMESGELELEGAISAYRRGTSLLKHCRQQLNDAEQQLRGLEDGEAKDLEPVPQENP